MPSPHAHTLPGGLQVALGKLPARHDERDLKMANFLDLQALPPLPETLTNSDKVSVWPMFLNDSIGDCVVAGWLHDLQLKAALSGQVVTPTDHDALVLYEWITAAQNNGQGYDPSTGDNDNGVEELGWLNLLRRRPAIERLFAFTRITPNHHDLVKAGIYVFGSVYIGMGLPISAQAQTGPGRVWDVASGPNGAPGSWGGHCVLVTDYTPETLSVITWGAIQRMTWAAWDAWVDESYALLPDGWIKHQPPGIKFKTLEDDLRQLGAYDPRQ